MRARLLLIPFIFSVPAYGQDISSDAAANPPGQVKYAPVRDLSQLPMDGGWTYGEVLDKAAAGDFRANMLAGEYWMGLYYLNRGDLPLACLEHMQHFFRDAATASGHPAPKLMMTDPYGIFGIFKAQPMQPEHAEWLAACRKLAEKGDMDAVTALYTVTDLPEAELRRYLAPLEKKAASGDQDALAQLAFIKVDWLKENPANVIETLKQYRKNAPYEHVEELGKLANLWRTTGDIQDHWGSVSGIGFSQERWQKHMRPGHWNDPDILQIGKLGKPNQPNTTFVQTRLTPDEQYTHVTLWCLLSAPLIVSCDLEHIDSFTMGLLTNDEVIAVDQDPAARPARKAWRQGSFQVWTKELSDGSVAAGFFNTGKEKGILKVNLKELGLSGAYEARDLWKRADQGTVQGDMAVELNGHGASMFRFSKKK